MSFIRRLESLWGRTGEYAAPQGAETAYFSGQKVWVERKNRKGDIIGMTGVVTEILAGGTIKVKELFSDGSVPEGAYTAQELDIWRHKYGKGE